MTDDLRYPIELLPAPDGAHIWATGPLPASAPGVLRGQNNIMAYRLEKLTDEVALYGVEAFGHTLPADGKVMLEPVPDNTPLPEWWLPPSVSGDITELLPHTLVNRRGEDLEKRKLTHTEKGEFRNVFRLVQHWEEHAMVTMFVFKARSPVVECESLLISKTGEPEHIEMEMRFVERVVLRNEGIYGDALRPMGDGLRGSIQLDQSAPFWFSFAVLCSIGNPSGDTMLDDLTVMANEAAEFEERHFVPLEWDGEWMGVGLDLESFREVSREMGIRGFRWLTDPNRIENDVPPFASYPGANQGGGQPSLGGTFFAPCFAPIMYRPHQFMFANARDYAMRPIHLFENLLGDIRPVSELPAGATTARRQIIEADVELEGDQTYLPFEDSQGTRYARLANGQVDLRTAHDVQHQADLALVAYYLMTGSKIAKALMVSQSTLDLAQRQATAGWRSNGRGEGRYAFCAIEMAKAIGGQRKADILTHLERRLDTALAESATKNVDPQMPVRPVELYMSGGLSCQTPALIPYEEAQLAWAAWKLYKETESGTALSAAHRFGLTVASQLYFENGQWKIPYAVSFMDDGRAPSHAELRDVRYVHPSDFPIWWAMVGLRALVYSAELIDTPTEVVEHARAAIEWLDMQETLSLDKLHSAAWRTTKHEG